VNPLVRAPYAAAGALATLAARVVPTGGGKLRRSFAARAGVLDRVAAWARDHRSPSAPLVWIHAPSVGEGLMARPVMERIRHERPDAQIAYTFFSPSAESFAQSLGADVADYLPFDTAGAAQAMLDALTPAVIAFSKLDVWPVLTAAAAARRVRLVLTSATLSESSGRRSMLARLLLRDAYAALDAVGAVHADDAARLVALGVRPDRITVTGDVRYDQAWDRVRDSTTGSHRVVVAKLSSTRFTVVAGSTWPGDEACLFDAWPAIRRAEPTARLVIAPHEPADATLGAIESRAARAGLAVARLGAATVDTDVIVVDRMGVLADLYAVGDVGYVGGGFHDAGLHSVVEPAAHGIPVLFGPHHLSSRDAGLLVAGEAGWSVTGPDALAERVTALAGSPETQTRAGQRARGVIAAGLGAADKSAALILPMLRPLRPSR
jgi:3-deoxy-D-manno-octulosonic-acid transferase